jgi:three-Cys-motif partner protein
VAKVAPDPSDGLPAMEAQEWAADKHAALRRYLDISHAARRKFLMAGGAAYFELFSGPGRLFLKGTNQFIDGSPLVAHLEATRTRTNFTNIYLADEQQTFCSAVETRLKRLGASPTTHPLRSEPAAKRIAKQLRPDALNVGFLDPYNLGDLPLSIFETFAPLQRIDLLVHVSAMDLARALPGSMKAKSAPLDRFAPGWRDAVSGLQAGVEARGRIIEYWLGRIRALGFKDARVWNLIRGPNNQPLYWLVLVAKHELATQFWDEISKPPQTSLF